jgi:hypothetical protein
MATLDYKLSADTLNRVGRAKSSGYAASGIGDTSGLEDTLETIVEEGEKEKEEDKIKEQEAGLAGLSMEQGFNEQAERGSWGDTPELYEQMRVYMQADKEAHLAALDSEDPVEAQRILQDQNRKSVEMNKWSSLMKTAGEIHDETGWGALVTDDPVASYKLGQLTSMANGKMKFDPQGKMYIEIPSQEVDGEPIQVYREEIDQLVAQGIKPKERQADFLNSTVKIKEQGLNGTVWDESTQNVIMTNNKNMIDKKNAYSVAYDDWTGTKFIDDLEDFTLGGVEIDSGNLAMDENNDKGVTLKEARDWITSKIKEAKQGAITNEDFDVLQDIMARWMMGKQKTNFDDGARQRATTQVDKIREEGGQTNIAEANRLQGLLQLENT